MARPTGYLAEPGPDRADAGAEPDELLEVGGGQRSQSAMSRPGESDVDDALIVGVLLPPNEPGLVGPVDEFDV